MMRPLSFRWLVLFAVVVLVAACSSDGGASEDTAVPQSERTAATLQAELESAADALVDQWGSDRDAFFVVAWSLDAGYSAAQIIEAAAHDGIHADGTVVGASGSVLEPEYQPADLLVPLDVEAARFGPVVAVAALGIRSALGRLADEAPSNAEVTGLGLLQEVVDGGLAAFEDKEDQITMTALVIALATRGYSIHQILEGLFYFQYEATRVDDELCFYLVSTEGREVRPVHPPSDILLALSCPAVPENSTTKVRDEETTTTSEAVPSSTTTSTTTATVPETLAFPRRYVGGGPSTWSLSDSLGHCVIEGNTLEVTLEADGTLSGLYKRIETSLSSRTPPGATRATVECGDQVFEYDPIEITGSHTSPDAGESEPGTVVVEIVGWPEWHIEGEYSPSEMEFEWEIAMGGTQASGRQMITAIDYRLLFADEG